MDLIVQLIKQGKKSWIQEKSKKELIVIANELAQETLFSDDQCISEVRTYLRKYIDEIKIKPEDSEIDYNMASITTLEVFTGENWNAYRQQFECFMLLNDIPETKRVPLLITKVSTKVYEILTTLCAPESPVSGTYENICEKLKKYYHPVKNFALHQAEFRNRRQKSDENIEQYIMDLKKLSKNCGFKSLDDEIKERLLNGTYCDAVKFELLKEADKSLDVLIEIGKTAETAYKLVYNHEKEQEQTQMFKLQGRNFTGNKNSGQRQNIVPMNKPNMTCFCCGKSGHMKVECSLRGKFCSECGAKGHIYKMCRRNKGFKVKNVNLVETNSIDNSEVSVEKEKTSPDTEIFDIFYFNDKGKIPAAILKVSVNGKVLEFEVDTGADVSTITLAEKLQYFPDIEMKQRNVIFTNFDQSTSTPLGVIENLNINYESVKLSNQRLFVVKDGLPKIIGKDWLSLLQLWPPRFEQKVCEGVAKDKLIGDLKKEYSELFEPGMGDFKGEPIHLEMDPGAKPVFMPVRTVPFALKEKVKEEIKRLVENKRIKPVEYSEWGTPVVPVVKPDGTVRLCGDFRITINKYLQIDHYPLPTINDILMKIQGNSYFCELDLREAYLQAPLDEESQKLVTIVTEVGIYKYLYLPFGVSTGPGSFQRLITQKLNGLDVVVYIDNIYVYGKSLLETNDKLKLVLQRLNESGLKLKINKCKFFEEKLDIFGFEVNKSGVKIIKSKIEPLLSLPCPNNTKMLKSFLGKVNYYNRFLQNMAVILKPLYDCLKKDKFEWTDECDNSFQEIKKALSNTPALSHFDKKSTIILTCDSADTGVAAVLSIKDCDNVIKPVAFASKKLSDTQMKYPILEKEAYAIIFGVSKFYEFLFGHKFILQTDNEALTKILGPKYGIPKMAARRLQYWSIFLSGFDYEIQHIKSKNNPADYLSRVSINCNDDSCKRAEIIKKDFKVNTVNYINNSDLGSLDWQIIQRETSKDKILCDVLRYSRDGWPLKNDLGEVYEPYFKRKNEISVERECLLWGYRVIIPKNVQDNVMSELHASHLGITRMKEISRSYFWWPGMDESIENITKNCMICLQNHKNPEKVKLTLWPQPPTVWHRLHADFLGPLYSKMFLVVIDAYSKWPEAFVMGNITAQKTIQVFKSIFVRYGYPLHLVTDNGPTWTSQEFKCFCKKVGIKQSFTPTYYPATNGLAERFVDSFKSHIIKIVESGQSLEYACNLFLFDYRCTVHKTTGQSPAKIMFGRELRCRFSLLRPNPISDKIDTEQVKLINNSKNIFKSFLIGDKVMAKDLRKNSKNWSLGKIVNILVPGATYMVEVDGLQWKRHANQLLECGQNLEIDDKLVVAFAVMIFFVCAVYPYTGSGPLWPRGIAADTDQCRKNWWLSLLMLSNYIDSENICLVVSWYIPCDFHCFCVAVLLYWLYKRCPRLACTSAVVITILTIVLPGVINYVYDMPAVQLFTYEFVSNPRASEHFHLTYIKTHTRAGAYIVGFISGFIFIKTYNENSPKISKKWSIIGSITGLVVMLVVMVMGTSFIWRSYHPLEGAIYAALNRPIWTCGVAMVVLCCALGHVPLIKGFLCWYPWVPLSRLAYGLYLTHSLLISRNVFTTRNSQDNDYPELLIAALGVIVVGCVAALVIWLLVEAPANNLLALLLRPSRNRRSEQATEGKLSDTGHTSVDSLPSSSRGHLQDNLPATVTFSSKV